MKTIFRFTKRIVERDKPQRGLKKVVERRVRHARGIQASTGAPANQPPGREPPTHTTATGPGGRYPRLEKQPFAGFF